MERVLWMAIKMLRGLGHKVDEEVLRVLGLLCLKRKTNQRFYCSLQLSSGTS